MTQPRYHISPESVEELQGASRWAGGDGLSPRDLNLLAYYSLPVVNYLAEEQPDIIIGCDRGARLFALAVKSMWTELTDSPIPTIDRKVHFAKISAGEVADYAPLYETLTSRIGAIITSAVRDGERAGHELSDGVRPKLLFIDDWTHGGGTYDLTQRVAAENDVQADFAVIEDRLPYERNARVIAGSRMYEKGYDGSKWLDRDMFLSLPFLVGIDYDANHDPRVQRTKESKDVRRQLGYAVKRVAKYIEIQ